MCKISIITVSRNFSHVRWKIKTRIKSRSQKKQRIYLFQEINQRSLLHVCSCYLHKPNWLWMGSETYPFTVYRSLNLNTNQTWPTRRYLFRLISWFLVKHINFYAKLGTFLVKGEITQSFRSKSNHFLIANCTLFGCMCRLMKLNLCLNQKVKTMLARTNRWQTYINTLKMDVWLSEGRWEVEVLNPWKIIELQTYLKRCSTTVVLVYMGNCDDSNDGNLQ